MLACQQASQPATTRAKLKKGKNNTIIKHSTPSLAMPDLPPKKWGKVDKAALQDLIDDGTVDVNDLSARKIDTIRDEYFCHRKKKPRLHRRERPRNGVQRRKETAVR